MFIQYIARHATSSLGTIQAYPSTWRQKAVVQEGALCYMLQDILISICHKNLIYWTLQCRNPPYRTISERTSTRTSMAPSTAKERQDQTYDNTHEMHRFCGSSCLWAGVAWLDCILPLLSLRKRHGGLDCRLHMLLSQCSGGDDRLDTI